MTCQVLWSIYLASIDYLYAILLSFGWHWRAIVLADCHCLNRDLWDWQDMMS